MSSRRLVRDVLLVAVAIYVLAGAAILTIRYYIPATGEWDVLLPDRTAIMLLYLIGFGLVSVLWLTHRQSSRSGFESATTK